jgi:hypothetical protein
MTTHENLAGALIAAQQAFGDVTKGKRVDVRSPKGSYSYTYADLGAVLDAVMPALHANGLVIAQRMGLVEGTPCVMTDLLHAHSNDALTSVTPIYWAERNDTQKYGGAITYARRYAIMALLCLNAEDDDGQQARRPPEDPVATDPTATWDSARKKARDDQPTTLADHVKAKRPSFDPGDKPSEEQIKNNIIAQIEIVAKQKGQEGMKERIRQRYMPLIPEDEFSRKMLSVDQLTEILDTLKALKVKA